MNKMNLIDPSMWSYEFPWGNTIEPATKNQRAIKEHNVLWYHDRVEFHVQQNKHTECYYVNDSGLIINTDTQVSIGHMVSTTKYHYGTYRFKFRLPNSRGAWPAIWMIPIGEPLPPEIDIFEQFRKDSWLTRFAITATYHYGPNYAYDLTTAKKLRKGCLKYMDTDDIEIEFIWLRQGMFWKMNGKEMWYVIQKEQPNYPTMPMNLIIGNGIGLDWKPSNNINPFILKECSYMPN